MTTSIDPSATQVAPLRWGDIAGWRIRHAGAELLLARQGAQILSYRRDGEPPVIWLSDMAAYAQGQSVRGGVPICWPWFGDLQRNPPAVRAMAAGSAPFHGLARLQDWELVDIGPAAAGLRICLQLAVGDGLAGWPHRVEPRLDVTLGDALLIELRNRNLGSAPAALSQALHSYFAVSDVRDVVVGGLQGCRYHDALDDWQLCKQPGELHFSAETDRVYLGVPSRLELRDRAWRRAIVLETRGSHSAIVWNPWAGKGQRLSQFAADAWQRMLCIETANVLEDSLLLGPGQEHVLSLRLSVAPLA